MSALDIFFKLGEKATGGDICKKAKFDYILYWVVFLTFISLAVNYFYTYFFKNGSISMLMWGIIISIFCWFNYWALATFRGVYQNMKQATESLKKIPNPKDSKEADEMIKEFENGKPTNKV